MTIQHESLLWAKTAYDRFHARGFEILGMNGDADIAKPRALLGKLHISWAEAKPDPELLDKEFRITSWPKLLLVDEQGTMVSTSQSDQLPLSGKDLEETRNVAPIRWQWSHSRKVTFFENVNYL